MLGNGLGGGGRARVDACAGVRRGGTCPRLGTGSSCVLQGSLGRRDEIREGGARQEQDWVRCGGCARVQCWGCNRPRLLGSDSVSEGKPWVCIMPWPRGTSCCWAGERHAVVGGAGCQWRQQRSVAAGLVIDGLLLVAGGGGPDALGVIQGATGHGGGAAGQGLQGGWGRVEWEQRGGEDVRPGWGRGQSGGQAKQSCKRQALSTTL